MWSAFLAILLYASLAPRFAMPMYHYLLFHPVSAGNFQPQRIGGLPVEAVHFKSKDGTSLFGWFVEKPGAKRVTLISHGNGGNITIRQPLMKMLLDEDSSVFVYDYEGYGLSMGKPSLPHVCDDAVSAYDYLVETKHYSPKQIVLYGESLGTGISWQLASKRQCRGMILQCSFTSLSDLARQKLPFLRAYPNCLFPDQMLDSMPVAAMPHAPVLMLHGDADWLTPLPTAKNLFAHTSEPKAMVVLHAVGHNNFDFQHGQQAQTAVHEFLERI